MWLKFWYLFNIGIHYTSHPIFSWEVPKNVWDKNQARFEIVRCLEMIQDWLVKWLVHALEHLKRHILKKHWEGIFFRANKPRCWSTLESITSFPISNGFKFLVWMESIKLSCWVHHMNHKFIGLMLCQWKLREEKMCPK